MMDDTNRNDGSSRTFNHEQIIRMFQCDLPKLSEAELAHGLLELRRSDLKHLRTSFEPFIRDELRRRRSPTTTDPATPAVAGDGS